MEREPWDSPLDDEQSSTEQESGDILFEDEPRIKLKFTDYKGWKHKVLKEKADAFSNG